MSVWGILDCPGGGPSAVNGLYVLRRLDPLYCNWRLNTSDYKLYWLNGAGRTDCFITPRVDPGYYFYFAQPFPCNTFMNNEYEDCTPPLALGYGGTVMIFWP